MAENLENQSLQGSVNRLKLLHDAWSLWKSDGYSRDLEIPSSYGSEIWLAVITRLTIYIFITKLIPTSTSLFEKLRVSQLPKAFGTFYVTRKITAVFVRDRHNNPSISQISVAHTLTSYFIYRFNIILHSSSPFSKQCFLFKRFGQNFECTVPSPPSMLRVQSISSALILVPQYTAHRVGGRNCDAIFLISDLILLSWIRSSPLQISSAFPPQILRSSNLHVPTI